MTIEENIFKRAEINTNALAGYGFRQAKGFWIFERPFMNGDFKAVIRIDSAGRISGTVYEIATEDEYLPLRVESMDGFAAEVRDEYEKILVDIKEHCCQINPFMCAQSNRLTLLIKEKYGDDPKFLFKRQPGYGVFKNPQTNKWYGMIMNIRAGKLDKNQQGETEIIHLKLTEEKVQTLLKQKGFYPSFKKNWISILLDDTVLDKTLLDLLDESHRFTIKKQKGIKHA